MNSNIVPSQNVLDEEEAKLEMDNLKQMMIRDCNITEAVGKLNLTRKYRKELMKKNDTDMRKECPFFLSKPKLVGLF